MCLTKSIEIQCFCEDDSQLTGASGRTVGTLNLIASCELMLRG